MGLGIAAWFANRLAAAGFGTWTSPSGAAGDTIFIGIEPETPDDAITIIQEGGQPPIGAVGLRPGVTIRTRRSTYEAAVADSHNIARTLQEDQGGREGIPVSLVSAVTSEPIALGWDNASARGGRFVFTQSFQTVTKRFAL
jgi:hypothetical protein